MCNFIWVYNCSILDLFGGNLKFSNCPYTYVLVFRLLLLRASQSDTNQETITHYVDIFIFHKRNLRGIHLEESIYPDVKRFCQLTSLVHFVTRHSFGVRSLLEYSDFLVRRILLALSRIPSSSWWIKSNKTLQLSPQFTAHKSTMDSFNQLLSTFLGSDAKKEQIKHICVQLKPCKHFRCPFIEPSSLHAKMIFQNFFVFFSCFTCSIRLV